MDKQKELGQYMTPLYIAEKMVEKISIKKNMVCLDPACGDGNLLLAAAIKLKEMGIADISNHIIGVDIDKDMIYKARNKLNEFEDGLGDKTPLLHGDFFSLSGEKELIGRVTSIISNPPYGEGRELKFFEYCQEKYQKGTEMVFLVPLAFIEKIRCQDVEILEGRPLGVTTGHAIVRFCVGEHFEKIKIRNYQKNSRGLKVYNGVKLYEIGAGTPPQTEDILKRKPFSSDKKQEGWIPCLRTGDIKQNEIVLGRMYVNYGEHLAQPKHIDIFRGPKIFVRRLPEYGVKGLSAVYSEDEVLCAGDVLIVRDDNDDRDRLAAITKFLNSEFAARMIYKMRPTVQYRAAYHQIAGKDLNMLFDNYLPDEVSLLKGEYS